MYQNPKAWPVLSADTDHRGLAFLPRQILCFVPQADGGVFLPVLHLDEQCFVQGVAAGVLSVASGQRVSLGVEVGRYFALCGLPRLVW